MAAAARHAPLLSVLVAAAALRLFGLNWDEGHHLHPDERFIAIVASKITLPDSPGAYFDTARSPLNPYNNRFDGFAYGTLPLFLGRWLAEITGLGGYDQIVLLGRTLSALADLGTVAFTYALANMLYVRRAAIVSALVLAFSVLNLQLSHFFTFDTFATFFVVCSLYFAHRVWMFGGILNRVLLGVGVGFAVACKISALSLALIVLLVCLVPWPGRARPGFAAVAGSLATIAGATLLAYRLAEPYAFLGTHFLDLRPNPKFLSDMLYWVRISSGEIEAPFMVQWANTPGHTFVLDSIIRWGLGPAAGLASLAGLLLAAWRLRLWGRHARHLLLVVWAVLNLAYFGGQFAKFMRYLLPIYPVMAILAGYGVAVCLKASERLVQDPSPASRWVGRAARCSPLLVLIPTILWSLAFVHIYTQPNPRLAASDWLIQNLPNGAVLAIEHWDDALPLSVPGRERKAFRQVSMNLYDEENAEKRRKLLENLAAADYLILASNRLYGSIPRLPERYPLATEYYRALFDGRLGYERIAEFKSRPRLLGFEIDDDGAQEDFTVYDHPTVQIFRRAPDYSQEHAAMVLNGVSLANVRRVKPVDASAEQRPPLLTPEEWARAQAGGTWSTLFNPEDLANRVSVPLWWLAASFLGLLAWPLLWWAVRNLADGGYGLARTVGLLLIAYAAWLLASIKLLPFGGLSLGLAAAGLAIVSLIVLSRSWGAFRDYLRASWIAIAGSEAAFSIGFLVCLWMRLVNPDLWHPTYGGEKPMDFAYLNAVIKSDYFPPYDPWFAGGSINYYYFGFVLVAALVKLTGVVPSTAYNLALALWFGLLCQTAFSVAYNLALARPAARRPRALLGLGAGALAVLFAAIIGNLDAVLQLREALWKTSAASVDDTIPVIGGFIRMLSGLLKVAAGAELGEFDFWRSTRLIGPEEPGPIHEFPFFSFLYGDLHAHLLALPLTLVVIGLALDLSRAWRFRVLAHSPVFRGWPPLAELAHFAGSLLLIALVVGALRATNTWDFPTYLVVVFLGLWRLFRPLDGPAIMRGSFAMLLCGSAVFWTSSLLFKPYLDRYQLFYSGVEPVKAQTSPWQFLTINGLWFFILASYLALELRRRVLVSHGLRPRPLGATSGYYSLALPVALHSSLQSSWRTGVLVLALCALALTLVGLGALALTLALGVGFVALAWSRQRSGSILFICGLSLAGLLALSLPEIVAIKGDVGRMNTLFKFYFQAWILLSLSSAVSLALLIARRRRYWGRAPSHKGRLASASATSFPGYRRQIWMAAIVVLISAALLYPLRAAPSKLAVRFSALPLTLDGTAFMQKAVYQDRERDALLPADHAALRWMQQNIEGSPVVLEANSGLYKWGSRVSIYTGLPTVVGWDWHQKQQRVTMAGAVEERLRDVRSMFESSLLEQALPLLRKYGVTYVYVGGLERIYYPASGLEKFEQAPSDLLQPVYRSTDVTIYRMRGQ